VGGPLLNWFRCFLMTRRQRVVLNGSFSSWLPVISGVPQGTILGPLLFILYLNDLAQFVSCKFKLFADDVTLYHQIVTNTDCLFLQDNLYAFLKWCHRWLMRLQPPKCEALCISNKRYPPTFTYLCDGVPLQWSSVVRYLGIYINQHLTWSDHCKFVSGRASKTLNLLRRLLYCCSPLAKRLSFCALVLPILQYGCAVWLPHYKNDVNRLEAIQYKAARWICGSRFNPSSFTWSPSSRLCLSELHWPSVYCQLTTISLLFLYDLIHNWTTISFDDYFTFNCTITRSHSKMLTTKSSSINAYRFSFFVNIVFLWNSLPVSVCNLNSRKVFRCSVLNHFSSV